MAISFDVTTKVLPSQLGQLLGFCDLEIGGELKIVGFKVFRSRKDNQLFISSPSQASKKTDENGKTQYFDTVLFIGNKESEDDRHTNFQKEVYDVMLQEFQKAMTSGSTTPVAPAVEPGESAPPPRAPRGANPLWNKR